MLHPPLESKFWVNPDFEIFSTHDDYLRIPQFWRDMQWSQLVIFRWKSVKPVRFVSQTHKLCKLRSTHSVNLFVYVHLRLLARYLPTFSAVFLIFENSKMLLQITPETLLMMDNFYIVFTSAG